MKWKKRLAHAGILAAVFVAAVLVFAYVTNRGNDSMTADMGAASYPQIAVSYQGYSLNTMSGYARKMDVPSVRDTISPIENGKINLDLRAYENQISGLTWTVYSPDGEEELLNGKVKNPAEQVSLEIEPADLKGREGVLEIVLATDIRDAIYYYTRVTDAAGKNILENLDYIRAFHEGALAKDSSAGVEAALETDEEGDNSTYQHVTIHSDYAHVSWGNLEPQVEKGERWMIKEINSVSISVEIQFLVRCKGEENDTDLYQAKEYFRVRHVADQGATYLLDYDRTMEQIFDPTRQVLNENGILLGVTDADVSYMVNGDGEVVSFVTAGELWNYNKTTDEASLLFSFMNTENTDERNLVRQHKIRILSVDEEGNTMFAVYGYMNRGEHEGEVGAAVYSYDISQNSVEEKVFVSIDKGYAQAVKELDKIMYYSASRDVLYTMMDGMLYEYTLEKNLSRTVVEGLTEGQYAVSADGRLVGYQADGDVNTATTLKIMNLENGKEWEISCGENECIRPLGFIGGDAVYGVTRTGDTGQTVSGEAVVPMYKVEIQGSNGKVKESYQPEGMYVLDVQIQGNMITLDRAAKNGDTYTAAQPDYITNNTEQKESNISLESYSTELKGTQMRLTYEDGISDKEPKVLKPKQVLFEAGGDEVAGHEGVIAFQNDVGTDTRFCTVLIHNGPEGLFPGHTDEFFALQLLKGHGVPLGQSMVFRHCQKDILPGQQGAVGGRGRCPAGREHHIQGVFRQIVLVAVHHHVDLDVGVNGPEFGNESGKQGGGGENANPQFHILPVPADLQLVAQAFHGVEDVRGISQQDHALVIESQVPPFPGEKFDPEFMLQIPDHLAQ